MQPECAAWTFECVEYRRASNVCLRFFTYHVRQVCLWLLCVWRMVCFGPQPGPWSCIWNDDAAFKTLITHALMSLSYVSEYFIMHLNPNHTNANLYVNVKKRGSCIMSHLESGRHFTSRHVTSLDKRDVDGWTPVTKRARHFTPFFPVEQTGP